MAMFYATMGYMILLVANLIENIQMAIFGFLRNKEISYLNTDFKLNIFSVAALIYLAAKVAFNSKTIENGGIIGDDDTNITYAEKIIDNYH